jgi:membrane protease YdiL (CAAX protease family)
MAKTFLASKPLSTTQGTLERLSRGAPASNRLRAFVRVHPLLAYFAITLVISWVGVLLVVALGPGRLPVTVEQFAPYRLFWGLAMVAGPTLSGLLMTGLVDGKAGLRDLLSRLVKWRVGARWYAIALLSAPFALAVVLLPFSLASADFRPAIITTDAKVGLLLAGVGAGLMAGVFEELGWTGFAVPKLSAHHGVLATGLLLGIVWGTWHVLPFAAENGTPGGKLDLAIFLPNIAFFLAVLPAFRVLLVWFYSRTKSLLLTMVMHASLSATVSFILAPQVTGWALGGFYLTLAGLIWVVALVVAIINRGRLSTKSQDSR